VAFLGPFIILESAARLISSPGTYDAIEKTLYRQNFQPRKKEGEYRVFLFGESTMHGSHLYPKSTIGIWLKLYLENLLGPKAAKDVTIYNLSRLGVNSHFIKQVFLDTLHYKPDLVVFYTAHNDTALRDDKWDILDTSFSRRANKLFKNLIKKSALISACRRAAVRRRMRRRGQDSQESEKIKEGWYDHTNKRYYSKDDQLDPASSGARTIIRLWQDNIREIIRVCRRRKIPVIFFSGLARYDAFEPYASVHDKSLTAEGKAAWEKNFKRAQKYYEKKDYSKAAAFYEKCLKIDPTYALTYFRLGMCYERLENFALAKKFYVMANDADFTPIRGPSAMGRFYDALKKENQPGVYVIPTQEIFEARSPNGMITSRLVVDQLHPTMRGQAIMALEICRIMAEHDLFKKKNKWRWAKLKDFETLSQNININEDFRFRTLLWSARYVGSYFDKAEEFLDQAVRIRPKSLAARSQLAWIYWKTGQRKKAAGMYRQLIREFPDEASAFLARCPEIYSLLEVSPQ